MPDYDPDKQYVTIEDGFITINVSYEYHIAIDRCDTPEKLLSWMVHLCEKTWMHRMVLREFAHRAANASGFTLPTV